MLFPLAMVRFWTANLTLVFTEKTPTAFPPLIVIRLPPSMVVRAVMVLVLVTVIVAAPPQLKVTFPPAASAAFNGDSVQLPAVPVPTMAPARAGEGAATARQSSAKAEERVARTGANVTITIQVLRLRDIRIDLCRP